MLMAYKFRIYPNNVQKEQINKTFGCVRFAYNKFFKENAGYPKYKSKHNNYKCYTTNYTNGNIYIDFDNNKIKLPKLKYVKRKIHRRFDGIIKNATISQVPSGKYYVSILVDTPNIKKMTIINKKIGIDLGIKDFIYYQIIFVVV